MVNGPQNPILIIKALDYIINLNPKLFKMLGIHRNAEILALSWAPSGRGAPWVRGFEFRVWDLGLVIRTLPIAWGFWGFPGFRLTIGQFGVWPFSLC